MVVNRLRSCAVILTHKLKVMRTLFDKINIESIEFESGNQEVYVNCKITQGFQTFQSELVLNHTDLNLLIGRIQQVATQTDILSYFDKFELENGQAYYSLQMQRTSLADLWLNDIQFGDTMKQIRA
jgi:hypothetical protein